MTHENDEARPVPIGRRRRLKSLNEFERPWWYPTFELPSPPPGGISSPAVVGIGLVLGTAIGVFLIG